MKTSTKNSRREFIRQGTLAVAGTMSMISLNWHSAEAAPLLADESFYPADDGAFKLAPLPYAFDALNLILTQRPWRYTIQSTIRVMWTN